MVRVGVSVLVLWLELKIRQNAFGRNGLGLLHTMVFGLNIHS